MLTCAVVAGLIVLSWDGGGLAALPRAGNFVLHNYDDGRSRIFSRVSVDDMVFPFPRAVVAEAINDCD